jgi:hypothetical protein
VRASTTWPVKAGIGLLLHCSWATESYFMIFFSRCIVRTCKYSVAELNDLVKVHIPSSTSANTNVMRAEETYCGIE